jgi:hypothetical protein
VILQHILHQWAVKINKERGNYKDENATDMLDIDTIELLAFIGL